MMCPGTTEGLPAETMTMVMGKDSNLRGLRPGLHPVHTDTGVVTLVTHNKIGSR
jgi:hypothetical protein